MILRLDPATAALTVFLIAFNVGSVVAQSGGASAGDSSKGGPSPAASSTGASSSGASSATPNSEKPKGDSVLESYRQTLLYGINDEVTGLVKTLSSNKDARLAPDVYKVFQHTYDEALKTTIVSYFTTVKYQGAETGVRDVLSDSNAGTNLVTTSLQYLSGALTDPDPRTVDAIVSLFDSDNTAIASAAVDAVGTIAAASPPATSLKDYDYSDAISNLISIVSDYGKPADLQASAILALGSLRAKEAVKTLLSILTDQTANSTLRQYSANSLGKIGDPSAVSPLTDLLSTNDTFLRAYVVEALSHFPGKDSSGVVEQALRDSFWRVRQAALESVAENKITDAIPAVIYKAEHDPDTRVRLSAIETLGTLGTSECWNILFGLYENPNADFQFRSAALDQMLKDNLDGALHSVEKVVTKEWNARDSRILDATGRALSTLTVPSSYDEVYAKFLSHPNYIIQIYGLRGIARNHLRQYRAEVEQITRSPGPGILVQTATDTLEELTSNTPAGSGAATGGTNAPAAH